ncbi:MAG: hypothetical protein IJB91_08275, partial [Oscillospiraceae bacterium]|nr:hypothetical protein [Oscillospiraceae bacterium]
LDGGAPLFSASQKMQTNLRSGHHLIHAFWVSAFLYAGDLNSKCSADERCRHRLDGGAPLFSASQKMQTNLRWVSDLSN